MKSLRDLEEDGEVLATEMYEHGLAGTAVVLRS